MSNASYDQPRQSTWSAQKTLMRYVGKTPLAWPFADGEGGRQGCELAWDLSFGFKPNTDAAPAAIDGKVKSGSGGTLWVAPEARGQKLGLTSHPYQARSLAAIRWRL